jgi:VanZ family protein
MTIPRSWLHAARIAAAILFYPALGLVIWGELTPAPPSALENIYDKILHFIAYFGLAWLAGVAVTSPAMAVRAFLALVLLGGLLEIAQGFTGRDMSVYDELANTIGVLVGGFAARVMVEPLRRRIV